MSLKNFCNLKINLKGNSKRSKMPFYISGLHSLSIMVVMLYLQKHRNQKHFVMYCMALCTVCIVWHFMFLEYLFSKLHPKTFKFPYKPLHNIYITFTLRNIHLKVIDIIHSFCTELRLQVKLYDWKHFLEPCYMIC